jgi:hypothetical protein
MISRQQRTILDMEVPYAVYRNLQKLVDEHDDILKISGVPAGANWSVEIWSTPAAKRMEVQPLEDEIGQIIN